MKISEVVTLHPSVAAKSEYDKLLRTDAHDDIIAFIMDDNNPEARRIELLRHLDKLLGDVAPHYGPEDLEDFMHDNDLRDDATSAEEADEIAHDMKLPPYHLSIVGETQDEDIPTGEYEICQRCDGAGCIECEEGLKDITGMHKIPNFDDYQGE